MAFNKLSPKSKFKSWKEFCGDIMKFKKFNTKKRREDKKIDLKNTETMFEYRKIYSNFTQWVWKMEKHFNPNKLRI